MTLNSQVVKRYVVRQKSGHIMGLDLCLKCAWELTNDTPSSATLCMAQSGNHCHICSIRR